MKLDKSVLHIISLVSNKIFAAVGNFFPNFEFHVRYLKTSSTNYSELFSSSFSDIFAEKYSSNVGVGIVKYFSKCLWVVGQWSNM